MSTSDAELESIYEHATAPPPPKGSGASSSLGDSLPSTGYEPNCRRLNSISSTMSEKTGKRKQQPKKKKGTLLTIPEEEMKERDANCGDQSAKVRFR